MHNKSKEKIVFTIPDSLISEVDHIVKMENSNREDFAKAAFQFYITQKKKIDLKETIKTLGVHHVNAKLYEGVSGQVKVNVVSL